MSQVQRLYRLLVKKKKELFIILSEVGKYKNDVHTKLDVLNELKSSLEELIRIENNIVLAPAQFRGSHKPTLDQIEEEIKFAKKQLEVNNLGGE